MTGPVDLGQTYRYRHTIRDSAGVLANAGSVIVTITKPDGTTATPPVVNTDVGIYDFAYTTTQIGLHNVRGTATGGILGSEAGAWEDVFTVEQTAQQIIGVDEASAHLRATGVITSTVDREQLRWLCLIASEAVEGDLNRVIARRTVVDTYNGGVGVIHLRSTPVISITSVVEDGVTLTAGVDYLADLTLSALWRGTSKSSRYFADGRQSVVVTYVAGYVNPPRAAREMAKYLVQALWQESQQSFHPGLDESGVVDLPHTAGIPGLLLGAPDPLRKAYNRLRNLSGYA